VESAAGLLREAVAKMSSRKIPGNRGENRPGIKRRTMGKFLASGKIIDGAFLFWFK